VYNKDNKTIKGDRNMKNKFIEILLENKKSELDIYEKIIFNYDILNDEDNNFRNNLFSDILIEKGYIKSKVVDTFYEKNLKSITKNDLKEEFRKEAEELKKKLKETIKDYNQENDTNIKINYRFDLSSDNKKGTI
jgi:hypothetical protein